MTPPLQVNEIVSSGADAVGQEEKGQLSNREKKEKQGPLVGGSAQVDMQAGRQCVVGEWVERSSTHAVAVTIFQRWF